MALKDLGRSVIRSRAATELLSFHLGLLHQQPAPSQHLLVFGIFWQFLSIFVMMTVLSKRYVAPLIKALKPRVGYHNISPPYLLDNLKKQNFTDHLKFCCLTILQQRHARTNSRALSLTSENRGKEVPSEADVVVIGKNSPHLSLQVFIAISRWGQSWLPDPVPPGQAGRDQHRPAGEGAVDGRSVHNKRPP